MIPGEVRLVNGMAWQHAVQFCLLATCARTSRDVGWYFPREALEFRTGFSLSSWPGLASALSRIWEWRVVRLRRLFSSTRDSCRNGRRGLPAKWRIAVVIS